MRGKNDACTRRWKFRFLIHAPVTHSWRGKIEAIIEGWLVFDESLTRRERKRYGIDETSPCVRPCVQLKNKCRKSRARLSRKNEFSIQFFSLFLVRFPLLFAHLYGLFPCVSRFYPPFFFSLRTLVRQKKRECRLKTRLIFDRFKSFSTIPKFLVPLISFIQRITSIIIY